MNWLQFAAAALCHLLKSVGDAHMICAGTSTEVHHILSVTLIRSGLTSATESGSLSNNNN